MFNFGKIIVLSLYLINGYLMCGAVIIVLFLQLVRLAVGYINI